MGELAGEKQTKIHAKISTKTSGIIVFMDEDKSFMPEIYTVVSQKRAHGRCTLL